MDLPGHVRRVSKPFLEGCQALMDHPLVGDARGIGLFCGIELVKDKATREQYDPALKIGPRVQDAAHATRPLPALHPAGSYQLHATVDYRTRAEIAEALVTLSQGARQRLERVAASGTHTPTQKRYATEQPG